MPDFDPYHKWLGIPPPDQPPDHYRLLGLSRFESDPDVIEAAADRVVAYLQSVATGPHVAASQRLLNEVAAARRCLLKEETRAAYDADLRARYVRAEPIPPPAPPAPPLPGDGGRTAGDVTVRFPKGSGAGGRATQEPVAGAPGNIRRGPGWESQATRRPAVPLALAAGGRATQEPVAGAPGNTSRGPGWESQATRQPAVPLALAAGGGAVAILVAVAWLAWGLGGPGTPNPTSPPTRKNASSATARRSARPQPPAGEPQRSLPLPVTAPDGPAPELDTSDWFSTSPQQPVRVERGALVLAGTGAVNRQFPNASGPVTVELRAGGDGGGTARILWIEQDAPDFAPQRSVEVTLAPDGQWQVLSVTLPVVGVLTGLRIDPPEGCPRLELDRIHLQTAAGKTLKEWGFGATALHIFGHVLAAASRASRMTR